MRWLVDIDEAVSDSTITAAIGVELKRRAREAMVSYAINLALFAGIVMVIGGAVIWLDDRAALTALGVVLTAAGVAALLRFGPRVRLVANATGIIGATLAIGAFASLIFDGQTERIGIGTMVGLPVAVIGWTSHRRAPEALSMLSDWLLLLGAAVHIFGILTTESDLQVEWLVFHYVGAVIIACGLLLNVRFVTALAIVPLAVALSSRTFYTHGTYGIAIYEVTLTILQMSVIAVLALMASVRFAERLARHARLLGQLALIWVNVAFWIGSLWGDVVGLYLWGPRWEVVSAGTQNFAAWREAISNFEAETIVLPSDAFAAVWALGIVSVGAWGAFSARRAVLNISVTFGAIHFYTQYFERLEATPQVFIVAGVIAIIAAWAMWTINHRHSTKYLS